MKKTLSIYFLIFNFIVVNILSSCQQQTETAPKNAINSKIDSLLAGMTLEEKVGQMTQITLDVFISKDSNGIMPEPAKLYRDTLELAFKKYKIGSVLNTANKVARTREFWKETINQLQEIAIAETGIPILYGIDAIHGNTYTAGSTLFPQEIGQGATFNPALVKQLNEITAYEMRASNIPWNFSPVMDLARDARDARFWETYSEDVYVAQQMGIAAVEGLQGNDPIIDPYHGAACLKHFLAYNSNSGKDRNPLDISVRELKERHAASFQAAIDAGAKSIMINSGLINGLPVHANVEILTQLLRNEMGFDGMIVTDWLDIENLHRRDKIAATQKEAVKMAINAGIDMSMVPYNFNFCDHLIQLVKDGEVPMERIDDAVRRILKLKVELNLFEKPTTDYNDYPKFGCAEFEKASLETALESITLLKNNNNILPLKKKTKVLVAGPNANSMRPMNGGWSYSWQGDRTPEFTEQYNTFLEAIQKKIGAKNVSFVEGVSYKMDGKYYEEEKVNIDAACQAAKNVDYILLFLGENSYCEKPGDLHDLYLSENQTRLAIALAKTGKPVILILNEGRPRIISKFEPQMAAVIQTYLPSNFGGDALAQILFGEANPSGKLPYTYPMFPNSLITYDYKPAEKQKKLEGMYNYESEVAIQYEFGQGLSYSTFSYRDFSVSSNQLAPDGKIRVSVTVENTGDRPGKEVVMLFTSDLYASISPDNKRLRRFQKIELNPAESKTVEFELSARDLAFYNYQNQLVAEDGEFILRIEDFTEIITLTETVKFGDQSKIKL